MKHDGTVKQAGTVDVAAEPHRARRGRRWHTAFPRLSHFALEHLLLLPIGAAIALVWVNMRPESYYPFADRLAFVVNDIGMVFFFGLVAKEVVEATAPGGVLHSWRRAMLPVIAALGATIVSALIYLWFVRLDFVDEPMLSLAWPVPFATDVALAYFVARLIFGRSPVIPFVLLVALAADAFGFAVLPWAIRERELHVMQAALLMAVALIVTFGLRNARVKSFWPYVLIGGTLSWWAFYRGGFHPTFALLPILPFLPHAPRDPGFFVDASPGAQDALSRFELWTKYPAQAALFFFGLINAGVPFRGLEEGTWAVPAATLAGKPIGMLIGVGVAVAIGLRLPPRVGWRDLFVIGVIVAPGFTVALYFTTAILAPGQLLRETTMGVLLALMSVGLAFLFAKVLGVGRYARAA
jgi:Na+:H+ antiporter, NhaA family